MTTQETILINKMIPQSQQAIDANREWYPRWIVQLVHGDPTRNGVIVDEQYVTKKWERVLSVMQQYFNQSNSYPLHAHGEWYVTVQEIVSVSIGNYTNSYIEQKEYLNDPE